MQVQLTRNRQNIIEQLQSLNFTGPFTLHQQDYMLYHGTALMIPAQQNYTTAEFRKLLQKVDAIISDDDWQY